MSGQRALGVAGHRSVMSSENKNRIIILAIIEGKLTAGEAAGRFKVSKRWVYQLLARYRAGGLEALQPRSRRPHSSPHATPQAVTTLILSLRESLATQGLDAGPESIWDRLPAAGRPSTATIWRILQVGEQLIQPGRVLGCALTLLPPVQGGLVESVLGSLNV